jgi:hypothetical protein
VIGYCKAKGRVAVVGGYGRVGGSGRSWWLGRCSGQGWVSKDLGEYFQRAQKRNSSVAANVRPGRMSP